MNTKDGYNLRAIVRAFLELAGIIPIPERIYLIPTLDQRS